MGVVCRLKMTTAGSVFVYLDGKPGPFLDKNNQKREEVEFCWNLEDAIKIIKRKGTKSLLVAIPEYEKPNDLCREFLRYLPELTNNGMKHEGHKIAYAEKSHGGRYWWVYLRGKALEILTESTSVSNFARDLEELCANQ